MFWLGFLLAVTGLAIGVWAVVHHDEPTVVRLVCVGCALVTVTAGIWISDGNADAATSRPTMSHACALGAVGIGAEGVASGLMVGSAALKEGAAEVAAASSRSAQVATFLHAVNLWAQIGLWTTNCIHESSALHYASHGEAWICLHPWRWAHLHNKGQWALSFGLFMTTTGCARLAYRTGVALPYLGQTPETYLHHAAQARELAPHPHTTHHHHRHH